MQLALERTRRRQALSIFRFFPLEKLALPQSAAPDDEAINEMMARDENEYALFQVGYILTTSSLINYFLHFERRAWMLNERSKKYTCIPQLSSQARRPLRSPLRRCWQVERKSNLAQGNEADPL